MRTDDRFDLRDVLGRGSLGVVHRAFDRELSREVALKTLPEMTPHERSRLKSEYRTLSGLHHPNLVQLYELFVDPQRCFFTMELVEGRDLSGAAPANAAELGSLIEQLAMAVDHLHSHGILHRDIKPANVMVSPVGRVALLDFGLAMTLREVAQPAPDRAGTLDYMAPEIIFGRELTPAADWYSVGALLHELLTGDSPFRGSLPQRLASAGPTASAIAAASKQGFEDPALHALCEGLLRREADERLGAAEVFAMLQGAPTRSMRRSPLVGRETERERVAASRELAMDGPRLLRVVGPSGIGKTALLSRCARDAEGWFVLAGRCHPGESIPHRLLDGVVEELARVLESLEPAERAERIPPEAGALGQLFREFARVPELAPLAPAADPREARRRAASALAALFERVGRLRPVMVLIDDVQWGDVDSIPLLRELLRSDARLLLVVSHRTEDAEAAIPRALDELVELASVRAEVLEVGPLPPRDSELLLRALVENDADLAKALDAAQGSPFLLRQLAADPANLALGFERALSERLVREDAPARRVVELACLAGHPLRRESVLRAAGLEAGERPLLDRLCDDQLLLQRELETGTWIGPYHARLRAAVVSELGEDTCRAGHASLLAALEADGRTEVDVLAEHAVSAGDADKARRYCEQAGERALSSLAFEAAAQRLRQALDASADTAGWELHAKLAQALGHAGRGGESGERFEVAARTRGAGPESLRLRISAAEQYLRSGRHQRGKAILEEVLGSLGESLPTTPMQATLRASVDRVRLLVRGRRLGPSRVPASTAETMRLDALWSASSSLNQMNFAQADSLAIRHLRRTLQVRDPGRLARALAVEATFEAALGGAFLRDRSAWLLTRGAELAAADGATAYDAAWITLGRGVKAWLEGRWPESRDHTDAAIDSFSRCERGASYEIALARLYGLAAKTFLGELDDVGRLVPELLEDAAERGDLFALNNNRLGQPAIAWLVEDRPQVARRHAAEAANSWPDGDHHNQHYLHLISTAQCDLYEAEPHRAWERIGELWPRLKRAQFFALVIPRIELLWLRGRVALALYATTATRAERRRLRRDVAAAVKGIRRAGTPMAEPVASLLEAGLRRSDDDEPGAVDTLRRAERAAHAASMKLVADIARHCRTGTAVDAETLDRLKPVLAPGT